MIFYVQLDKVTNIVLGYSSSKINENDIEIEEKDLEERFLNSPIFYVYIEDESRFEFREELREKYIKEKESRLTDKQKIDSLTKQLAKSKVENMKQKSIMNNLIKQRAEDKIDYMKSRNIIDVLTKQQAQNKIEIMKLKGGR